VKSGARRLAGEAVRGAAFRRLGGIINPPSGAPDSPARRQAYEELLKIFRAENAQPMHRPVLIPAVSKNK